MPIEIAEGEQIVGADQNVQDAGLCRHGLDPIELLFDLFTIPGLDQMLGFVQNHRAQGKSPKLFFIGIAHFRIIRVCGGLAFGLLLLDQVLCRGVIHLDASINGGLA